MNMADRINVVIVDDIAETRDHLAKLLSFEPDINVAGSVASGPEASTLATRSQRRRRPARHQHARHGRHRHGRTAGSRARPPRRSS